MQLPEAKERFIEMWGNLGTEWGITRSMAQIHALLLLAEIPLSADMVMDELQIARGNANMHLRALIDWGLVKKEWVAGDRKEYFVAHKDMWFIAKQVMLHRKKRELEPMIQALYALQHIDNDDTHDAKHFEEVTHDILVFAEKADSMLTTFVNADKNWLLKTFISMVK
jgi:DNA-binding transcriptional regulator GbsR (MarR family)